MSSVPAPPAAAPAGGAPAVPPTVQVFQLYFGVLVTQIVLTMTEHDLPERLADGARRARSSRGDRASTSRSLYRAAAHRHRARARHPERRRALRPRPARGTRPASTTTFSWVFRRASRRCPGRSQTGKTGLRARLRRGALRVPRATTRRRRQVRHASMRLIHAARSSASPTPTTSPALRSVVDVGGGNGDRALRRSSTRIPQLDGVLFDLPSVVGRGTPSARAPPGAGRPSAATSSTACPPAGTPTCCRTSSTTGPRTAALRILDNCRDGDGRRRPAAHRRDGGARPATSRTRRKMLDMLMLVVNGAGMERTEAQYAELLDRAGFRLERVVPTASPVSIVEAVPQPR